MSVIEFARQRMEEESREPDGGDCRYWRDGALAQAKEDARKEADHD